MERAPRRPISPEEQADIVRARDDGATWLAIAVQHRRGEQTVREAYARARATQPRKPLHQKAISL